jgi:hypothetical protein
MMHEIGLELSAELAAKGCPYSVIDGPENFGTVTWGRPRIVIEHDDDAFSFVRSQRPNPKQRHTVRCGYKLTIYAQSTKSGAQWFEHLRLAEHVRDMVLVAMDRVAAARKNEWEPKSGKFITPDDLTGAEIAAGAVYQIAFTFDRGVQDVTWAGAAKPETTLGVGGMRSTTKVSRSFETDDDGNTTTAPASAETSCGN